MSEFIEVPVLSGNGRRALVSVPSGEALLTNVLAAVGKAGFTSEELYGLVLWPSEVGHTRKLPVPKPTSPDDILPDRSSEIFIGSSSVRLFVLVEGFDGGPKFLPVDAPLLQEKLVPPFPKGALMHYSVYWEKVKSWRLGPGTFTRDVVHKVGTTKEESTTMAAELGVAFEGLSAKLSGTFSTSIKITDETETSEHYSFSIPEKKVCIFTIWNLVHGFQVTDAAGKNLIWNGNLALPPFLGGNKPASLPKRELINRSSDVAQDPVFFDA